MDLTPEPLPSFVVELAEEQNVKKIALTFSGDSNACFLNVYLDDKPVSHLPGAWHNAMENPTDADFWLTKLIHEIEEWAWKTYPYVCGDGNTRPGTPANITDYGDDIVYNLASGKVTTRDWYTEKHYSDEVFSDLVVAEDAS